MKFRHLLAKKLILSSFARSKIKLSIPSSFCRFLFDLLDHYPPSLSILLPDFFSLVKSYAKKHQFKTNRRFLAQFVLDLYQDEGTCVEMKIDEFLRF